MFLKYFVVGVATAFIDLLAPFYQSVPASALFVHATYVDTCRLSHCVSKWRGKGLKIRFQEKFPSVVPYVQDKMMKLAAKFKKLWQQAFNYFREVFQTNWTNYKDMLEEFSRYAKHLMRFWVYFYNLVGRATVFSSCVAEITRNPIIPMHALSKALMPCSRTSKLNLSGPNGETLLWNRGRPSAEV
jgi:hypothetical protein